MATQENGAVLKKQSNPHNHVLITACGLLIALSLAFLSFLYPAFLRYLNLKVYDEFLSRIVSPPASARILIVDIDEESLREHGQWPWPRYKLAALVDRLNQAGAAAIGLDMMFPERDRSSPTLVLKDMPNSDLLETDIHPDHDRLLAEVISRGPVILGFQFLFESTESTCDCRLHPLNLKVEPNVTKPIQLPWSATRAVCNLDVLTEAAAHSGFLNVSPDVDGILRNVPAIMEFNKRIYPSLALATVMEFLNLERVGLVEHYGDHFLLLGRTVVPLNASGALLVDFRGKGRSFPYVTAAELLAGRVPPGLLKNKIIFVGTSAAGLKELHSTPLDPLFPGVEVHATVADNLLAGDLLSRPASAEGIELLIALACGILYAFSAKAGALKSFFGISSGMLGLVFLSFHLFDAKGIFISPLSAMILLAISFALLNLLKFRLEELKSMRQTRDLALAQAAIIDSMASLTETRDPETGGHIKRTQEYVRLLAEALRDTPEYRSALTPQTIDLLYKSAPLHDIGKVGVSDSVLLKPGKLTKAEFAEIQKHSAIGRGVIAAIQKSIGDKDFLNIASEITYTHHEKWDGSGYPEGLQGEQIPLSGRLMAIADVYDALTSRRVYKEALSHEEAVRIMTEDDAPGFDPKILNIFKEINESFRRIAQIYKDT